MPKKCSEVGHGANPNHFGPPYYAQEQKHPTLFHGDGDAADGKCTTLLESLYGSQMSPYGSPADKVLYKQVIIKD